MGTLIPPPDPLFKEIQDIKEKIKVVENDHADKFIVFSKEFKTLTDQIENELNDFSSKTDEAINTFNEVKQNAQNIENSKNNAEGIIKNLQSQLDSLIQENETASNQLNDFSSKIDEAINTFNEVKQNAQNIENSKNNAEGIIENLKSQLNELTQENESASNKSNEIFKQIQNQMDEFSSEKDTAIETFTALYQEKIKSTDTRLDELEAQFKSKLKEGEKATNDLLDRCETAYSAATSVGLAKSFNDRSESLSKSMWIWVAVLIVALIIGSIFGKYQLNSFSNLFKTPDTSTPVVALNLLLSIVSVGSPIWLAWLATKQIGQRFRLSEDYAFKASVSSAYEGFRRETEKFDNDMAAKLLTSALTRLDELPIRLVDLDNHGSPWHELLSSKQLKLIAKKNPDLLKILLGLISTEALADKQPYKKSTPEHQQP